MARTAVVTGSASGIGKATKELLGSRGDRVIGVDLRDADIVLDLSTDDGRAELPTEVERLAGETVDAVYAIAGLAVPAPATVAVNFFGAIATLEGLRRLLLGSPMPRAVTVSSMASLLPADDELVAAMDADDEPTALARAEALSHDAESSQLIYPSSKQGVAKWIRRNAASDRWAGAGIPLNAVAPAIVDTPMTAPLLATEEGQARLRERVPMPLRGMAEPMVIAHLLTWLGSAENTHMGGQVVFIDGGFDAATRGDSVW